MKLLLTAGPTREAIDPVRFLTNRSSGKMGYALAEVALAQGYEVHLVSGPVTLSPPTGAHLHRVESAQEMYDAVARLVSELAPEVAILTAAVADYRPKQVFAQKFKKSEDTWTLELEKTPDILGSMRGAMAYQGLLVGFAAETENLLANAHGKLERKGCDLLVANDVSQSHIGFDSPNNAVTLLFKDEAPQTFPEAPKLEIAFQILHHCERLLRHR